jgi:hypothetical protein
VAPAFSQKATRAKDPILHGYADLFVEKMNELGEKKEGVSLPTWVQWLAMDIAAEMAYHHQVNCMKNGTRGKSLSLIITICTSLTYHGFNRKRLGLPAYRPQLQ